MDLVEQRRLLADDRQRTLTRIAALTGTVDSIVDSSQLTNTDDEHDPEGATLAFEREQAGTLLRDAAHHLDELDAALARIESGAYGTCESCGAAIAPARLEARPAARTCIDCAT